MEKGVETPRHDFRREKSTLSRVVLKQSKTVAQVIDFPVCYRPARRAGKAAQAQGLEEPKRRCEQKFCTILRQRDAAFDSPCSPRL